MTNFFEVKNVTFSSSENHKLVDINFGIESQGNILSILGPSGVGKTILKTIAGLRKLEDGEIWLDNILISSKNEFIEPEERKIALSFSGKQLISSLKCL